MGDRCYMTLLVRRADLPKVKEVFESHYDTPDDIRDEDGAVRLEFYEIGGGGHDELRDLAAEGIPFIGHNGPGYEYGSCDFYSFLDELRTIEKSFDGDQYVVSTVTDPDALLKEAGVLAGLVWDMQQVEREIKGQGDGL